MFRNLFVAAILAALCAGLVNSAIQHFRVIPLILHAETFEGQPAAHTHEDATAVAPHEHGADEWAPADGAERTLYTVLANLLVAAAFALILGALSMFTAIPITLANGALWGIAGFFAVTLAPAYGLPPELPGMPAAEVFPRQVWWFSTVIATAAAIYLIVRTRALWALAVAAILVAAPHVIGAPVAPDEPSAVPAHLATEFAANALGTAAIFWVVLGLSFGWIADRLAAATRPVPVGARA